jgi:AcrR family transcriptional regulator
VDLSNVRTAEVIVKAAELIQRRGFEATTVNEISKATGLTKGGLYHYITGKRDLLYQIMRFGMEMLQENVVEAVQDIEDPEEQLRTLIVLHVELISKGKGALTTLNEEVQGLEPKHRKEILAQKREYFDFVRDMVERLKKKRRLRKLDTAVATFSILGMVLFFARWYREKGTLDPTQIGEQVADIAMGGILRDAS